MEKSLTKIGNGSHQNLGNGSKNRLRIQGTAILERENQANICASYDYMTPYVNEFFEEDVNELRYFELNKIALGMTIFKKDPINEMSKIAPLHENGSSLMLHKGNTHSNELFLTDVIWSRMDIANPHNNPNAYIIKQYYPRMHRNYTSHADKCNNFLCGFLCCCIMLCIGCALTFLPSIYQI